MNAPMLCTVQVFAESESPFVFCCQNPMVSRRIQCSIAAHWDAFVFAAALTYALWIALSCGVRFIECSYACLCSDWQRRFEYLVSTSSGNCQMTCCPQQSALLCLLMHPFLSHFPLIVPECSHVREVFFA